MPGFVVDPLLVTTPPPEAATETVRRYLERLEMWLEEVQASPFEWRHFLECTQKLQEIERFPTFSLLRDLARAHNLDFNVRRLVAGIDTFFQDSRRDLLARTATRYALLEEAFPKIIPADFVSRNLPVLHDPLITSLLCLACDRAMGEPFASSVHLATLPFEQVTSSLRVVGTLALIEPEAIRERLPSQSIDMSLPVLLHPNDFQTRISDVLEGGPEVFRAAVVRTARRLYRDSGLLPFTTGPSFWESLWESTINTNTVALEKLIRLCAALVANSLEEFMSELRPVRSSVGPQSAQRIRDRDGARGWRMIVTKKGIGWRLHYWHIPARLPHQPECIEVANVIRMQEVPWIPE